MFYSLFLISVFINGFVIESRYFKNCSKLATLANSFIIGSILSISFIYFLSSYVLKNLQLSLIVYFVLSIFIFALNIKNFMAFSLLKLPMSIRSFAILTVGFLFSWHLFARSFSYDIFKGQFLIASHIYADFGVHIPFIRSFSLGNNFPMEVPFFGGKGLLYHQMFDLYAGILEFLGLRIDLALNFISALSFLFLLIFIYRLSYRIFSSSMVGFISIALFLFNSSLSFVSFIQKNGFNNSLFSSFWHNSSYLGNGPLGENTVSVLWNLNTFLNQRQLIFGILFLIFLIDIFMSDAKSIKIPRISIGRVILLSVLVGIFPLWHMSIFLMIYLLFVSLFVFFSKIRKEIFLISLMSFIIALPVLLMIKSHSFNEANLNPGFMLYQSLTVKNFLTFWFWNLGLSILSMVLGALYASREQRKLFFASLILFIVPNLFQFGKDIYDNHKFFSTWIIFADVFSAFALFTLFKKNFLIKIFVPIFFVFLTASGILNILVIKNDVYARINDYPKNTLMKWALKNIAQDSLILTNGEIYDPMSIIGKKTFLGNSHQILSYGGNPDDRITSQELIFSSKNPHVVRDILSLNGIKYVVFYKNDFAKNIKYHDYKLFKENFMIKYEDAYGIVFEI